MTDCQIHEKKKRLAVRSIYDPVPIRCRPPSASGSKPEPAAAAAVAAGTASTKSSPSSSGGQQAALATSSSSHSHGASGSGSQAYPKQSGSSPGDDKEAQADLEKRLVNLIDEGDTGKREIKRGVRAIYVGHELSNMSFLIRQQRDKDDDVYHFAGNEIPDRQLKIGHDQLIMDALTLPEQDLADELVQAYFAYVNPGYPIIDEDLFMAQYRNRDPGDPPPILLLQSILLVGAHVSRPKAERDALKEIFFRRTKWLFDSRVERNRDIMVQAALLMTWHSENADDDVSSNAYYWVGVAARIATGLGMHRNPVSSRFLPRDRHMWRRLWFILVQFDVLVSLSYGRPQAINLEDSDVSPLTAADFEGCGANVQIDYVIHFSELCFMISNIIRERFGLRVTPERRKTALQEADGSLANWSLRLPDNLRLRASDMDPWSAMLHLTYNNFLILLHRPHPRASAYSDDYGPHDAEICSAAAGVIASIFEELRLNNRLRLLWYTGVHTLFTAMIQVRVELRFSNPVLAINALRRFDSASHSLRELSDYWLHATTILRLFEDSRRLQEDLQTVTTERPRKFGEADTAQQTPDQAPNPTVLPTSSQKQPQQQLPLNIPPTPDITAQLPQNPISQPAEFGNWMAPDPLPAVEPLTQPREFLDWRQLFSFTDPDQPVPMSMEGLPELEEEWRQIYWQDLPMSDLLQDGGWMHG